DDAVLFNLGGFTLTSNSDLTVGGAGDVGYMKISAGQVSNTGVGYVGTGSGADGTVTVDGAGSLWDNSTSLRMGSYGGTGTLNVQGGGRVSSDYSYLGHHSGSIGTVTVDGTGSLWENSSVLRVGISGTGTLNVQGGGQVSNTDSSIGQQSGADGTVTVGGTGSLWDNSGSLYVGGSDTSAGGTGALTVQNDGTLGVGATLKLWSSGTLTLDGGTINTQSFDSSAGTFNFNTGTLTVDGGTYNDGNTDLTIDSTGAGATLRLVNGGSATVTGNAYVGSNGTGSLTVQDGGKVSNAAGLLGANPGAFGTVSVNGAGSTWSSSSYLYVGDSGTGTLNVLNGGQVSTLSAAYVGDASGSDGTVTVDGAGSTWTSPSSLVVGKYGTGTLTVQNGGRVSNTYGDVGRHSGADGTVTVDGTGSLWDNSGSVYVGGNSTATGGTGVLNIRNGSLVEVTDTLKLWDQGRVNLDGGELRVGTFEIDDPGIFNWISGRLTLMENNTWGDFTVDRDQILGFDYSTLTMLSDASLFTLGELDLSNNSTLVLDGGQLIQNLRRLDLGQSGRITGEGEIFTGHAGLDLGQGGELAGSDDGLTLWGNLYGSGAVSNTTIYGDVYVGNSPGTMAMTDVDFSSSSTLFMELAESEVPGTDYDRILFSGDIDFSGVVMEVLLLEGFIPDLYDSFALFDFSSATVSGHFEEILLPGLDPGLFWDTSEFYNLGTLEVSSAVPLPASVWLFVFGLIGLIGFRRKRR
ncbi:MAG: hypothetical protein JRJ85_08275, partial [Deltaproteobacteria bacterium]|nr:hypothetical protein [Deltaproteobacteria bacterium]